LLFGATRRVFGAKPLPVSRSARFEPAFPELHLRFQQTVAGKTGFYFFERNAQYDYGEINACRQAVDDFRKRTGIAAPLIAIDKSGVYWKKSG